MLDVMQGRPRHQPKACNKSHSGYLNLITYFLHSARLPLGCTLIVVHSTPPPSQLDLNVICGTFHRRATFQSLAGTAQPLGGGATYEQLVRGPHQALGFCYHRV